MTSHAHVAYNTDGVTRRPWAPAAVGLGCFAAVVVGLTLAHVHHLVSTDAIAASPAALREGRLWLLLTSGLLVQSPIVLSLLSFAALGCLTLVVCGQRTLWTAALIGHVLSTLAVYAGLSVVRFAAPGFAQSVQSTPDYGVSAIAAAWLGAVAAVAWRRRGSSRLGRALVALGCVGIALFGWWSKGHLNVLDSEHVVAFAVGIVVARSRSAAKAATARLGSRTELPGGSRHGWTSRALRPVAREPVYVGRSPAAQGRPTSRCMPANGTSSGRTTGD